MVRNLEGVPGPHRQDLSVGRVVHVAAAAAHRVREVRPISVSGIGVPAREVVPVRVFGLVEGTCFVANILIAKLDKDI